MPNREQVKRAIAAIKSAADTEYFFDALKSPDWIVHLEAEGLFRHPPEPIRENQTIGFPFWPQSRYLQRMAPLAADEVLRVILAIPDTDNVRVQEDFLDAAIVMPADRAARMVPKVIKWASSPYQLLLPEKAGSLASRLASGGQVDGALSILPELLALRPDSPPTTREKGAGFALPPTPVGRFHEWKYRQILEKHVPAIVAADGLRTLQVLVELLDNAVAISRPDARGGADHSYMWRPSIEDGSQNHDHGPRDHLVSAVRDAAEGTVTAHADLLTRVVEVLEAKEWDVFRRLALHVLRRFPTAGLALAKERILDEEAVEDVGVFHEYWLLAGVIFPRLESVEQERLLAMLDDKLATEEAEANKEPTPEAKDEARERARHWLYRRLTLLGRALPRKRVDQLQRLAEEFGPIEHPSFLAYSSGAVWVGPTSPKGEQDISRMSTTELADFLRNWQPAGSVIEATPEGLGRTLSGAVAADPTRFASGARDFVGLDPTYVRAIFSGLTEAAKAQRWFEWAPVLALARWAVAQPRDVPDRPNLHFEADPHWGWARKAIAELLTASFGQPGEGLPWASRTVAWDLLEPLTNDPDPTPEREAQHLGKNMNPLTLSINTTRGEAMHTVVRYALWVRRYLDDEFTKGQQTSRTFDVMPEVRYALETHLDTRRDSSAAVRSVYGQWFPWLLLLDSHWTRDHIASIFPPSAAALGLWRAAWNAYISFGGTFDDVFEVLTEEYARAIARIGQDSDARFGGTRPDNRLAQHLMVFYWRGKMPLGNREGLLAAFYRSAGPELREYALDFVGRAMHGEDKPPVPDPIRDRLQALWAWRLSESRAIEASERAVELAAFGWWFASRKFPDDWALDQLLQALRSGGKLEAGHLVIDELATFSTREPDKTIEALTLIIDADKEAWGVSLRADKVETIISSALNSGNRIAAEKAADLVHVLGARGFRTFGRLLQGEGPGHTPPASLS